MRAQPWPEWEQMVNAANMADFTKSASSKTIIADLPPSSRKTRFTVSAAAAMMRRPTGSSR